MASIADDFDHHTQVSLVTALLEGATTDDLAQALEQEGVDAGQSKALVAALDQNPILQAARAFAVRLRCRDWWLRVCATLASSAAEAGIDRRTQIGAREFLSEYYYKNRPLVIHGLASRWRAMDRWSPEYLKQRAGHLEVEIMLDRDKVPTYHQSTARDLRSVVSFAALVDRVFSGEPSNNYYLVSRNKFFSQPEAQALLEDIDPPDFVAIIDPADSARMWFGPRGTVTKLHQDDKNMLLVQIKGRKAFRLYAPYYAYAMKQNMPWYAAVDPEECPDESPAPRPIELQIDPGDALFIPVGWWHEVTSLDPSISLTFKDFTAANDYGQI